MGELFLNWVAEDMTLYMFVSWQKFLAQALDYKPEYLHDGHLIDRMGYREFARHIFEGVEFNPEAKMADDIFWAKDEQKGDMHVTPLSEHKHAGPQEPTKKQAQRSLDYKQRQKNSNSRDMDAYPAVSLRFLHEDCRSCNILGPDKDAEQGRYGQRGERRGRSETISVH